MWGALPALLAANSTEVAYQEFRRRGTCAPTTQAAGHSLWCRDETDTLRATLLQVSKFLLRPNQMHGYAPDIHPRDPRFECVPESGHSDAQTRQREGRK